MGRAGNTDAAARQQRRTMSLPEVLLWQHFRNADVQLRRQHPIGPFVIDYYCPEARLGVEIDGIVHSMGHSAEHDTQLTQYLAERGIEIIRVAASDVLDNVEAAAAMIVGECVKRARG